MSSPPVLVTGAAGFIGAYVCQALQARGTRVIGLDNFNDYYDPQLKHDRVKALCPGVPIEVLDIGDAAALDALFVRARPQSVIHLAAQAGVRFSLESPSTYIQSNLVGFGNMLEACRQHQIGAMVYASSSSVYGGSATPPFDEQQRVDQPLSLYAATKASNELMAHAYAHLFGIALTGLRFFTVYGPWGRPDMAPILFSRAALAGRPIDVFNQGQMQRDFTWIGDIVAGVVAAHDRPAQALAGAPAHRVYNLGNHRPEALMHFIDVIERAAGRPIERRLKPMQAGDMVATMADTAHAERDLGFNPDTGIEQGLEALVRWCRDYYGDAA